MCVWRRLCGLFCQHAPCIHWGAAASPLDGIPHHAHTSTATAHRPPCGLQLSSPDPSHPRDPLPLSTTKASATVTPLVPGGTLRSQLPITSTPMGACWLMACLHAEAATRLLSRLPAQLQSGLLGAGHPLAPTSCPAPPPPLARRSVVSQGYGEPQLELPRAEHHPSGEQQATPAGLAVEAKRGQPPGWPEAVACRSLCQGRKRTQRLVPCSVCTGHPTGERGTAKSYAWHARQILWVPAPHKPHPRYPAPHNDDERRCAS